MGERKGQNHYYPPAFFSQNPKQMAKGLNAFHGHHALRERGKKWETEKILTIRFEMYVRDFSYLDMNLHEICYFQALQHLV